MFLSKSYHPGNEVKEPGIPLQIAPVKPGDFIILTVGIIISILRISKFISGQKHGGPAAAKQHSKCIPAHFFPEGKNIRILCKAFCSAVPAIIGIGTVRIVPAVGFVMLLVVGVQIVKGKAVMAGDKIHRCIGTLVRLIQIRRADDPLHCRLRHPSVSFQEAAEIIPITSVPFGPAVPVRETSHLVQPACIPCLGDELYMPQNGIIGQAL